MARKPKDNGDEPVEDRHATFSLDEGDVTIEVPGKLSAESITDLEGHLKLFLASLTRRAEADAAKTQEGPKDE